MLFVCLKNTLPLLEFGNVKLKQNKIMEKIFNKFFDYLAVEEDKSELKKVVDDLYNKVNAHLYQTTNKRLYTFVCNWVSNSVAHAYVYPYNQVVDWYNTDDNLEWDYKHLGLIIEKYKEYIRK